MAVLKIFYHGNCFDGAVSAAIFTRFYRECIDGEVQIDTLPMMHRKGDPFGDDHDALFSGDENVVLDFRYSPSEKLTWWCDHHQTAFLSDADQRHFESRTWEKKCFDPHAPSCSGLLARWLTSAFQFNSVPVADHVHWADIIDAAAFSSPKQAVELVEPATQLMLLLEFTREPTLVDHLIDRLSRESIAVAHSAPRILDALSPILESHHRSIELFRQRMEVEDGVAYFDLSAESIDSYNKFIPYYLFENVGYTVGLTRSTTRTKVSVSSNPWKRPNPLTNLGELCQRYGGGGHAVVGAISLAANEMSEGRKISLEITKQLRKSI